MTKYGRSPWIDRFPKSRVPSLPRQRGPLKIDVVIIGGGLTGCATAYAFAAAGVKVVLLEAGADRPRQQRIVRRLDLGRSGRAVRGPREGARPAAAPATRGRCWRRAALDFAALLRRLDVKC